MASPVDSARQGTNISTAGTSHAINVGSPVAGTLLIVFTRFAAAPGTVTFLGYTLLVTSTDDASDDTSNLYWRLADGNEGATDTLTTGNSVKMAALCWEITGAEHPGAQPPQVSSTSVGTTAANSANSDVLSPAGGSKDYLFLTVAAQDGEVGAYTAAPTDYLNLTTANSGTGGTPATNCYMGGASQQITTASQNPTSFTHGAATTGWTAFTIGIHPATTATTPNAKVPWHGVTTTPRPA